MAQASVLTDAEIRRVFRIIETTRHADRNRLAFVLSLYAGLRVGEIAALTIGDVLTQQKGVRREIKLDPHQTKGPRGRTVVLSTRVRTEIGEYLKARRVQRYERVFGFSVPDRASLDRAFRPHDARHPQHRLGAVSESLLAVTHQKH
jgi:integrase/recombinase XerD